MRAIEKEILPLKTYCLRITQALIWTSVFWVMLLTCSLIWIWADTEESKDLLGRTYEYCIQQFAAYEGVKGGEFYTPASIVKTIVAILKPFKNCRVYDPCCGSGGMFIQSADLVREKRGDISRINVYGQEKEPATYRLAKMNLALRGISHNLGGRSRFIVHARSS